MLKMMSLMILAVTLASCGTTKVKEFCSVAPIITFSANDTAETKRQIIKYTMIKSEYCE